MDDVIDDNEVLSQEEAQAESDALASAMAGYNARGAKPPAADSAAKQDEPEQNTAIAEAQVNEAEPAAAPQAGSHAQPPAAPDIQAEVAELKLQVKAIAPQDPDAARKLYGEIGNLNRQLKQLQEAMPKPAPVVDETTAAIEKAEALAQEYPELAGPLVSAIKAIHSKGAAAAPQAAPVLSAEQIAEQVEVRLAEQRLRDAEEVLAVDHPDFNAAIKSKEFSAWLNAKPADLQNTIKNTQNPILASRFMTEFKESQRVKEVKNKRLAGAVTPSGVSAPAKTSTIPDDEGFNIGYAAGPKRLNLKR